MAESLKGDTISCSTGLNGSGPAVGEATLEVYSGGSPTGEAISSTCPRCSGVDPLISYTGPPPASTALSWLCSSAVPPYPKLWSVCSPASGGLRDGGIFSWPLLAISDVLAVHVLLSFLLDALLLRRMRKNASTAARITGMITPTAMPAVAPLDKPLELPRSCAGASDVD